VGPILADRSTEYRLLSRLLRAARQVQGRDSKVRRLAGLLATVARRRESAIVFTEYRDTLVHLQRQLNLDCAILHGGLGRDARRAALASFLNGAVPVLLATDAAGEGLNLQRTCRLVINLELPWNPMRLEQRIGRVDRIGQARTVHAFHLIARDTRETAMVDRLAARIDIARTDVGAADPLGFRTGEDTSDTVEPIVVAPVRLSHEAAEECARLETARRLRMRPRTHVPASPDNGRSTFSFMRRRRSQQLALSHRDVLAFVQVVFADEDGDMLASLVARIRSGGSVGESKTALRAFVVSLLTCAPRVLDPAIDGWSRRCVHEYRAFWRTRLARERAILGSVPPLPLIQPGLFDRRANRAHERRVDQGQARHFAVGRWIRVSEQASRAGGFTIRSVAAVTARR